MRGSAAIWSESASPALLHLLERGGTNVPGHFGTRSTATAAVALPWDRGLPANCRCSRLPPGGQGEERDSSRLANLHKSCHANRFTARSSSSDVKGLVT